MGMLIRRLGKGMERDGVEDVELGKRVMIDMMHCL